MDDDDYPWLSIEDTKLDYLFKEVHSIGPKETFWVTKMNHFPIPPRIEDWKEVKGYFYIYFTRCQYCTMKYRQVNPLVEPLIDTRIVSHIGNRCFNNPLYSVPKLDKK